MAWSEDVNHRPLDGGDMVHSVHHPSELYEVLEIDDSRRIIVLWDETRSRELNTAFPSQYRITMKYDGSYPVASVRDFSENRKPSFSPLMTPSKEIKVLAADVTHLIVQPGDKVTYCTSEAAALQLARELVDQDKICYIAELKYKIFSKTEIAVEAMSAKDHIPDII